MLLGNSSSHDPNDNNKLHPKMLNGAGIAGRWSCCLCLSVWALDQGSLQTHLSSSQSFHGIWTRVPFLSGWSQDAPLAPMGLLTTAVGKDQGEALVAPFGSGTLCVDAHLTSIQHGILLRPVRVPRAHTHHGKLLIVVCLSWHSHRQASFPPQWQWSLQK